MDSPVTYDVIGTVGSPVTLTAAFAGNRNTILAQGFKKFLIEGTFTPGATNQHAMLLVETSNDLTNGSPVNFYPMSGFLDSAAKTALYADSGQDMGTASGIPVIIPGDETCTSGVAVVFSDEYPDLCAKWLRFSVRDEGSSNFGTFHLRVTLLPNA